MELIQLSKKVATFPRQPGVYIMRDAQGEVIYVGKAKSLRERVRSYFNGQDERAQISFLLRRVVDIENIVTGSEQQAFVLERDLIGKFKPRYNIRLKDDKEFLSIRLDENAEWPRLELVRRIQDDGARYYGPFSFSHELRTLLEVIKRVVPLRTCADTIFYNRQRPCLEYQIKRCAGPCCLPVEKDAYRRWVQQARAILEGRTDWLIKQLEHDMQRASEELRFEDAAAIRDRVDTLRNVRQGQQLVSSSGEDRDVFGLYREEQLVALAILKVRRGRISDNQNFVFREVVVSDEELLEATLGQYYEGGREVPDEVVLPCEIANVSLIKAALDERAGRAIEFCVPQRGIRQRLVGLAMLNAKEHFLSTFDSDTRATELSRSLAKFLGLAQAPRKVECIDISNFQGSDIVGALVCFFDGRPHKDGYRKYLLPSDGKPDDFGSVREVVRRRLINGRQAEDLPDLMIIDGGAGQLKAALESRDELGLSLDIVALAKERGSVVDGEGGIKPERIYFADRKEPQPLPTSGELLNFFKRIRDETHRFVITFHRARRSKRAVRSALDGIAGVGPERRSRLLRAFGSIEQIAGAADTEVAKAGRMPLPLARKILRILKGAAQ
ncbi:MAG: excinuclease ABC subunit UvrC [Oligoflexia bacterium]|nr:excinuclease ABC subunit UvrC [Oligoflexia bacterium]